MGNACGRASATIDFDTQIFDKDWFSKCLQHDLLAAQYTNVQSVNVVDGCTTAIARRSIAEGRARKVFIKCHIDMAALRFDSDRARLEVDLLNKLSNDPILSPHLPRLERTTWLDSHANHTPGLAVSESRSGGYGKIGSAGRTAPSHILMLEFERSAGNLLSQQVEEGLRLSERQAAEMASQLLRIISAMHAHQLCHGHISGTSLVLTAGPPAPILAPTPSKVAHLDPVPASLAPLGNVSSLSPPTSGLDTTEESEEGESTDGMSSWLLPGYPRGVGHTDVRHTPNTTLPNDSPGSPSEALLRASNAALRTPPRRCEGGAVSEASPVAEGRDRRPSTNPSPGKPGVRSGPPATRNTLSVNETFEGLASASVMSAISTRMAIPIRSMRTEIEQRSASGSAISESSSLDGPAAATIGPSIPAAPLPPTAPPHHPTIFNPPTLPPGQPVAEGAEGAAALGGTSSISWDAQVSDMIDQQLNMFAPAAAALDAMPSGMYKTGPSAFDVGAFAGADSGPTAGAAAPREDSDEQMNTRWSFEADAVPDAAEIARVFGDVEPKPHPRPPPLPVRTSSRASSSKPPSVAPSRAESKASAPAALPRTSMERRRLYDAVMEAGAEKFDRAHGKRSGGDMGRADADCMLRTANKRMGRGAERWVQPGPADAAKRRSRKLSRAGSTAAPAQRARPVTDESGVHVMLHLHGVSELPAVGGARLFAIYKDISAAGAALLMALTGEDADVYHLQRALEMRRPVSRQIEWTMLSADARDFVEGLLGERLGLEDAYQHPWMREHHRRAAKAQAWHADGPQKATPSKHHPPSVVTPEPGLKSARRKSPLSVASSANPSSPLTIQPVRKPSTGMVTQQTSSGPASPRLPRRDSGASIAHSRNPSHQNLSRKASQASLAREPSQGALPLVRDLSTQGSLSRNPSHGNLAHAESGGSARFRRSDSMSLIAPHRSASGAAPTPPRVPSEQSLATPPLAQRITEERVDESGKKHVVTKFVLPPRAPSNAALQLLSTSDAGGPAGPSSTRSVGPSAPASTASAADNSSDIGSLPASAESSAGLLSQPLLPGTGDRSDMLAPHVRLA